MIGACLSLSHRIWTGAGITGQAERVVDREQVIKHTNLLEKAKSLGFDRSRLQRWQND